jgi:thiol-disulfide isomerase/thioredoxin
VCGGAAESVDWPSALTKLRDNVVLWQGNNVQVKNPFGQLHLLVAPGNGRKLLAVGNNAPRWALPLANEQGKVISLTQVLEDRKNRLVLLEFWISHCGASIEAVPKLNAIASRFGSSGLAVLGINPDDAGTTIQTFAKNNAPHFTLLSEGQKVTEEYGVIAYPTVFLIDAEGTIVLPVLSKRAPLRLQFPLAFVETTSECAHLGTL